MLVCVVRSRYYPDGEVESAVADVLYQPKGVWLPGDVWKLRRRQSPSAAAAAAAAAAAGSSDSKL